MAWKLRLLGWHQTGDGWICPDPHGPSEGGILRGMAWGLPLALCIWAVAALLLYLAFFA